MLVAQWIAHQTSNLGVAGSNPVEHVFERAVHGFNSRTAPTLFFGPFFFGPISAAHRALGRNLALDSQCCLNLERGHPQKLERYRED